MQKLTLKDPYVEVLYAGAERAGLKVSGNRTKRDGSEELIEIRFEDLDIYELSCVGKHVRETVRSMRLRAERRFKDALSAITGYEES